MNDSLNDRLRRIYAAFGETVDEDLSAYRVVESRPTSGEVVFAMNFNQGVSKEQLHNAAHAVIHNVAHLKDHFKKFLRSRGQNGQVAEDIVNASSELKLVSDLSNNDKHGYPPRDGGKSGLSPRVTGITKTLSITAPPGGVAVFTMPLSGAPPSVTGGLGAVVVTGAIVNGEGGYVADLHATLEKGIAVWEQSLRQHGIEV